MTSILPNTRVRNSSAPVSMRNFENPPSSFSRPKILPLESVSPEMASALIDELMRVIEEQAEVKLHEMGKPNELNGEEYTPQNPPRMYNGRSFYEVNGQSRHTRPPSVVYTSVPQPSLQQRNGNISQPSAVSPPPLNLSRTTRDSISATTDSQPGSPFRRRSRFILVDQTEIHPGNRIESLESNVYKPTVLLQKFPTRMESIRQEEKPSSLPPLTSRRHSIDANQSYMSLSDTASVHEDSQPNSLLNYKKWMGAGKTGSRVTSQKSTSPVVVIEKPVKTKPAASKSKSFFSHFKYEMHPTPMYYVPDHKTKPKPKPGGQTKHPKRFSIDGSSSQGNSLSNIERTHTKSSSSVSTHSKEKKQELLAQNASKWPIPPPSRSPPQTPQAPLLAPQKSENTISQLPWNTRRVPVANSDLHFVEGWLADTNVETDSPGDPQSPIFSEKEIPSTAATSPIGSNRLSVVFEDHRSARSKGRGSKMQSRIISWVDLEGCTSEFVQSLQVLGTVEGLAPELTPVEDSSIVPTPSSKYTGDVFVGMGKSELDLIAAALERQSSPPPPLAPANKEYKVELPTTTTATPPPRSRSASESSSNSNNNIKRPRPHISPLVIPTSPYSIFPPQPTTLTQKKLPIIPSFSPTAASISNCTVANATLTTNTQKTYNFAEEDSPTLPPLLTIPPPRSSKRVRRPATPSLPQRQDQSQSQIQTQEEEEAPPIPTRLRPFTPPKPQTFLAPPTGLKLHLSRHYISQGKSEWVITSTANSPCPKPFLTSFSTTTSSFNNSGSASSSSRIDFTSLPQQGGRKLFTYFPRTGVAETGDGKVIFGVREGVFGSWVVGMNTNTNTNANDDNNNESGGVKKLQVRVLKLDDGREVDVLYENPQNRGYEVDAREMAGKIVAKGRNTYIVDVEPDADYAVMSCLTTVFDEWRVDEGFF